MPADLNRQAFAFVNWQINQMNNDVEEKSLKKLLFYCSASVTVFSFRPYHES